MAWDIFISYSSRDKKKVTPYADKLKKDGYKVWIDQLDISHGHEFPEEITKAIQECGLLLFFSSVESNLSKWVRREVIYADKLNKPILPVCLDNTEYNQSLQLLLSGVEHIDASKEIGTVYPILLSAITKELGTRDAKELCPIVLKECPTGKISKEGNRVKGLVGKANERISHRHMLRAQAFVFAALCEFIWLFIIGIPLLTWRITNNSYAILTSSAISFFLSIYATHLSTQSYYVPGWYNRNLTSYGALIITLEGFITLMSFFFVSTIESFDITHLLYDGVSVLGIIAMIMIFRLRKQGYYLLCIIGVLIPAFSYSLWEDKYKILGITSLALAYLFLLLVLTATLQLRYKGTSNWGLLFGKTEIKKDQLPSSIERILLKLWSKIYR